MGDIFRLGAVLATALLAATPAQADPVTLTLPGEEIEALVPAVTYPASLVGVGETLAEPAAVTDAELASAGVQPFSMPSLSSATLVVDDDLAQCPNATFTTAAGIQLAIAAAPAGATIRVCPGTYTPITVPRTLRLEAPRQSGRAVQCQEALTPDPTRDAIIDAGNTPTVGVTLAADGIVLSGFTVQNTSGNPGIYALPAFSGYELEFNVVQLNTFGLYLNASGVLVTDVHHNCFRFNNKVGAASGAGIYSDAGLQNAVVHENTFTGQNSASMIFTLNARSFDVLHNDAFDDAGTIVLVEAQNARVAFNHIRNTTSSGIFVGGGVATTTIEYNLIEHPGGTGITTNTLFVAVQNTLSILKNKIVGSPFDGIRLDDTTNSLVSGNHTFGNTRDGVRLRNNSDFNRVNNNSSHDNGRDGLRVDGIPFVQSNDNTIEQNKMLGNTEHDCHDDTVGAGTAGTANSWLRDIGRTENRTGLCKNAS